MSSSYPKVCSHHSAAILVGTRSMHSADYTSKAKNTLSTTHGIFLYAARNEQGLIMIIRLIPVLKFSQVSSFCLKHVHG